MGCFLCKPPENLYYEARLEEPVLIFLRRHEGLIKKLSDTRFELAAAQEKIAAMEQKTCCEPLYLDYSRAPP